jgi:hypothetical protein
VEVATFAVENLKLLHVWQENVVLQTNAHSMLICLLV